MPRPLIGVIGAGDPDPGLEATAERVGALVAASGCALVTGGLGGVMRAASKGARDAGGTTVGILPGTDPASANEFVDVALPTGLGEMRNLLVVRASTVLIAVGGGLGTLSEIALALKSGKTVIGLGTWDLAEGVHAVSTPEEAVELALEALKAG